MSYLSNFGADMWDTPMGTSPVLDNYSTARNAPSLRNGDPASMNPVTSSIGPPPLPPRPDITSIQKNGTNQMNPYSAGNIGSYGMGSGLGSYGIGGMGSYGMGGGLGSYGMGGMGSYGMGGMGSYGMGGMGGMGSYGMGGMGGYGYNNMGQQIYGGDIENRFIQIAEENSRPTFESIQSIVSAVGSIAMMMENTFCALTSSFRAILGVAENIGRLRSLFAQIWSTFAAVRMLNWLIRKLMVMLGLRSETEFKAWAEAMAATQTMDQEQQRATGSGWPALLFFAVVAAAPYIVLRMFNGLSNRMNERLNEPKTWNDPLVAVAQHDFQATSTQELSFRANQTLIIAPKHLQGTLWHSGWLMGTIDKQTAGLIPLPYIKLYKERTDQNGQNADGNEETRQESQGS